VTSARAGATAKTDTTKAAANASRPPDNNFMLRPAALIFAL
jgi:hypothetical protein